LSKIDLEVAEELDFEIGDCVIVIKQDGSLGKIVVPEMNAETIKSDGYKKMLDVIDILKPGSKEVLDKKHGGTIH
jgi:hypothetical protein